MTDYLQLTASVLKKEKISMLNSVYKL